MGTWDEQMPRDQADTSISTVTLGSLELRYNTGETGNIKMVATELGRGFKLQIEKGEMTIRKDIRGVPEMHTCVAREANQAA